MKYQLADLSNGPFGDVYDTLPEAEAALAQEIAAGQAINNAHAQEYADAGQDVPQSSDFFSIVEINDEAEAEAEHRSASIIQRQRSGRFDLYLWGKLHGQYISLIDAMQDAKVAGEHRSFRMLDAMTSKTDD